MDVYLSLSLSLMFMLAIECDQNVRTFWLCFTLNDQPVVEEPVSAGPEMKTHFTYMFYSNLHLTVCYTLQNLKDPKNEERIKRIKSLSLSDVHAGHRM